MTIGVFLVEDSPIALQVLSNIIATAPDLKIVGTATNGAKALLEIPRINPDVICTDLYMEGMDGLALIQHLMACFPKPILVISIAVGEGNEQNVFQLLQAGAVDTIPKPMTGLTGDYNQRNILDKIRILAGVKVFTRPFRPRFNIPVITKTNSARPRSNNSEIKIITIGASTGGPKAVFKILRVLPKDFSVPILCTQHISTGFLEGLVSWMRHECRLAVKIANQGEELKQGVVYYAPDGFNLEVDGRSRVVLSSADQNEQHCPSINVMFRSVAHHYGSASLGILLTGMGKDGASGLQSISLTGGMTIAQEENSCAVFGMPKVAIELGAVKHIVEIDMIGEFILNYYSSSS